MARKSPPCPKWCLPVCHITAFLSSWSWQRDALDSHIYCPAPQKAEQQDVQSDCPEHPCDQISLKEAQQCSGMISATHAGESFFWTQDSAHGLRFGEPWSRSVDSTQALASRTTGRIESTFCTHLRTHLHGCWALWFATYGPGLYGLPCACVHAGHSVSRAKNEIICSHGTKCLAWHFSSCLTSFFKDKGEMRNQGFVKTSQKVLFLEDRSNHEKSFTARCL